MRTISTTLKSIPPGGIFKYGGLWWCKLSSVDKGALLCTQTPLYIRPFGYTNDWYHSSIRRSFKFSLMNDIVKYGGDKNDFLKFESDLISADGIDDYGIVEDTLALLSDDMYRQYRDILTPTSKPFWTLTPHSTSSQNNTMCHYVTPRGDIDKIYCNWMGVYVRPVCVLRDKVKGIAYMEDDSI